MALGFLYGSGGGSNKPNPIIISGNTINYEYMDNGAVVIGTDSVNLYWRGAGYPSRMYIYNVDLTNIAKITITAKCGRSDTNFRIEKIGSATLSRVLFTGNTIRTVDIDVSSYTGLNTLEFSLNNYDTGYIYNMVMS